MSLDCVFNPRRVALVGASPHPGKVGNLLWRNLSSFDGEVIPVTPSAETVGGVAAAASLEEIEGEVDLAVVAVPARAVPDVARAASAKGVGAMAVLAGGFAETGPDGAALQEDLIRAAGKVRVVGPNCFGVLNPARGLNASLTAPDREDPAARPGDIALVTQTGAYGMALHTRARDDRIRFGKIFSSGNKADIADHEVVEYLRTDPDTKVICLILESIPAGRELAEVIRNTSPGKPVIVFKTGVSRDGARAARSHTGSLAADQKIYQAAMEQAGALAVHSGLEMLDAAQALSSQPPPGGARAAVITNSGGMGVELTDLLHAAGVETPSLSLPLRETIASRLPPFAAAGNPVDMTPVWPRFAELYPWLLETLARSGEVDLVIPILLERAAADRETLQAVLAAAQRLRDEGVNVPVYGCWAGPRAIRDHADPLQEAGIPCLEWPERTARAAGRAVRYALRKPPPPYSPPPPRPASRPYPPGPLPALPAADLLQEYGVATAPVFLCSSAAEARRALSEISGIYENSGAGEPMVMKTADPGIAHRTEAGGVRTGLRRPEEAEAAFRELAGEYGATLAQPQLSGVEMAAGALRDPSFGPVVMAATGGTRLELWEDVVFALAPVGEAEAMGMIEKLRGSRLLAGYRGAPPADASGFAAAVAAVSRLAADRPDIIEIDLNPVMVNRRGAVAVDWKITVGETNETNESTEERSA